MACNDPTPLQRCEKLAQCREFVAGERHLRVRGRGPKNRERQGTPGESPKTPRDAENSRICVRFESSRSSR